MFKLFRSGWFFTSDWSNVGMTGFVRFLHFSEYLGHLAWLNNIKHQQEVWEVILNDINTLENLPSFKTPCYSVAKPSNLWNFCIWPRLCRLHVAAPVPKYPKLVCTSMPGSWGDLFLHALRISCGSKGNTLTLSSMFRRFDTMSPVLPGIPSSTRGLLQPLCVWKALECAMWLFMSKKHHL